MRISDWSSDVCSSDLDVVLLDEDMPFSTIRLRTEGFRRSLERHGLAFDPRNNLALIPPARPFRVSQSSPAAPAYPVPPHLLERGRPPDAFLLRAAYYALAPPPAPPATRPRPPHPP